LQARIYTWSTCSFCARAKALLDTQGVAWDEEVIDGDRELFDRLAQQCGKRTMPFVLLDGEWIAGLEDLERELASG